MTWIAQLGKRLILQRFANDYAYIEGKWRWLSNSLFLTGIKIPVLLVHTAFGYRSSFDTIILLRMRGNQGC